MIHFGTGGWRAIIGDDFTRENINKVGQAIADYLKEKGQTDKPIMIGYDRRFLSQSGAKWISEVLAGNGLEVKVMKRSAPSPLVMHTVKKQNLYCGLEITASHNPPEYDGIKIIVEEGRDAPLEVTNRIEELIAAQKEIKKIDYSDGVEKGLISFIKNPFNDFIDDILRVLDTNAIRERGLRVLFDPMHGSGTYPLEVIFNTCRITVDEINNNKDAYFEGGYPAPSEKTLVSLADKVVKGGYDMGIAFDGDGDRLAVIDSSGRYVSMNEILAMLYWYLHEKKGWKGPVVRNVCTTHVLDRMAKTFGEECIEVPVGFKWVSAAIDQHNAVLGGESSGGLTVRGHIFGKDGIYAASLFAEMLAVTGMSIREISTLIGDTWGYTVFLEKALRFKAEDKININRVLMEEKKLPSFVSEIEKVSYMDGCKVFFKDGSQVSCRFSGTEPLLRIMTEADTKEKAESYLKAFDDFVGALVLR
ncbi:MAG: phosphoglucomutase/phosphomannomutase family protein [Spirochaetales bacterium]|nr:phosphoglucomutase/phosphomannomutase family protein [Candidatus Physcosoma equi]